MIGPMHKGDRFDDFENLSLAHFVIFINIKKKGMSYHVFFFGIFMRTPESIFQEYS
jgi:hypothetical protein